MFVVSGGTDVWHGGRVDRAALLRLLGRLRNARIGAVRAPHKPLLLLWLFGRFAATGSSRVSYAEAEGPVSRLINDFGPPATPAIERQRAAMPFVHLERELWHLQDGSGAEIGADAPERRGWLLERGAVGWLHPEVERLLAVPATLAAAGRLLLELHFTPVLAELICAEVDLDLPVLDAADHTRRGWRPASPPAFRVRRGGVAGVRLSVCDVRVRRCAGAQSGGDRGRACALA